MRWLCVIFGVVWMAIFLHTRQLEDLVIAHIWLVGGMLMEASRR